jgi:nicotinamidase-related amidase
MSQNELKLDPRRTGLVIIDLQKGIVGRQTEPHTAQTVVANAARLAETFRKNGSPVVLVRVTFSEDGGDRLKQPVDSPMQGGPLPPDWSEIVPELGPKPGDFVVTKRQWGAFYGTDLDLQFRRRGIDTIVLGGISTNMGVESTARDAFELGYGLVLVEDAMASMTAESHRFPIENVFPRLGRIRSTEEVLRAIA